jgi:hypothetical protein
MILKTKSLQITKTPQTIAEQNNNRTWPSSYAARLKTIPKYWLSTTPQVDVIPFPPKLLQQVPQIPGP